MHGIAWVEPGSHGRYLLSEAWWESVRGLPDVTHTASWGTAYTGNRMALPGAYKHAAMVEGYDPSRHWWRYVCTHAGKAKQAQLGWQGRQWGVINRHLLRNTARDLSRLSNRAFAKLLRILRRLTHGRKNGWNSAAVWYVRPEVGKRAVEWCAASDGPG